MKMLGRTVWTGQRYEDYSRTRGQQRAAEVRQWRREAREEINRG